MKKLTFRSWVSLATSTLTGCLRILFLLIYYFNLMHITLKFDTLKDRFPMSKHKKENEKWQQ